MPYIFLNNHFFEAATPVISGNNRAFKYGEGLFETMRLQDGTLCYRDFHFDRFFKGLDVLKFSPSPAITPEHLHRAILATAEKNQVGGSARVRLCAFRGEEDFTQTHGLIPNILIECATIAPYQFNREGLRLSLYEGGRKSTDQFANLKSNQYLLSALSILDAAQKKIDEQVLLNCFVRICESSKANIFCVLDQRLITPPLSEGCVDGIIRRFILNERKKLPLPLEEAPITRDMLLNADEVFLTNAIHPVRWVADIDGVSYTHHYSKQLALALFG